MPTAYAVEFALWEVLWLAKNDRIVVVDCGRDFHEAKRVYALALKGKKPLATLRCKNVGFPPPEKFENKMRALNRRGWWWCPYCGEMRRFEKRNGYSSDLSETWVDAPGYYCPMCDVSNSNGNVKHYNPLSMEIELRKKVRRGGRKRRKRRTT